MATEWTSDDEADWNRLNSMTYSQRTADEEVRLDRLKAVRSLVKLEDEERRRKNGLLYWPAIIVMLSGVGSCVGGVAWQTMALIGVGIVLIFVSACLNWLNSKMVGVE